MKIRSIIFTLLLLLALFPVSLVLGSPLKLDECFSLALKRSEEMQIREEAIVRAEAQYREALAGLFPSVYLAGEFRRRDNSQFGRVTRGEQSGSEDPSNNFGGGGSTLGRSQSGVVFSATQPIFNGFRDIFISSAATKESEATRAELFRARELLFLDLAEIYLQARYAEKEIAVIKRSKESVSARIAELQQFVSLGKSRESEVISTRAELAEIEASLRQIEGLRASSLELLSFLIGVSAEQIELSDLPATPVVSPLSHYLEKVVDRRDLVATRARALSQQDILTAAQREGWPKIDLQGNAYSLDDPERNRDWEVVLQLSLPIFVGGAIDARVAQQQSALRIAQLGAQQLERMIERDIKVAYSDLHSTRKELESLKDLRNAANQNLAAQRRDYRDGIVTNLDVLQAIRRLFESELSLVRVERRFYTKLYQLKVAAGVVEE